MTFEAQPYYGSERKIKIVQVETPTPIMDRIMDCESGTGDETRYAHPDQERPDLIHINDNGTHDVGIAQINSIWAKQATELGYNLAVEADNIAFAKRLYANKGTSPWSSSSRCWSH